MNSPAIEFSNFSFHYRAQKERTLHQINLRIEKGQKILIAGPSGSGKSTLGHCINGLIPYFFKGEIEGSLVIDGVDAATADIFELSRHVGTVLQDSDGQFVGLTVAEDIAFALENDCVLQPEMKERVKSVSRMVGMETMLDHAPQELSGGQKQRVSLAGVLVDNVNILLFDEPLANLDPATGKYAMELIDDLATRTGATILIVEHRLEDVLWRRMDRIVLMNGGRIICDASPAEMLASGILRTHGIREPLYVTALSYAGIPLRKEMPLGCLSSMDIQSLAQPLKDWFQRAPMAEAPALGAEILSFSHVNFSYYANRPVLTDISFSLRQGEMTAIAGKNGAGKSTLCKLICGFEKPDSGTIAIDGRDMDGVSIRERANIIGLVMQNPNQMISKPMIRDEVGLGLSLRGVAQAEIDRRVDDVLKICGLFPFRNWPISALSYGQKKRVTIASILILEPRVLLLDEPTAGQDYRHYTEIMEFLEELQQRGITILLVTHDMHLMLEYARRAIVIADGRLVADDSSARMLSTPEIISRANLKETSLYTLAKMAEMGEPQAFVQRFIDYEREGRQR